MCINYWGTGRRNNGYLEPLKIHEKEVATEH